MAAARRERRTRWALLLGCVPFVALVGALPWVNRVEPMILGLPFLLFWIFAWVALTPMVLFVAYLIERRDGAAPEKQP
jgi:hypothetical protein